MHQQSIQDGCEAGNAGDLRRALLKYGFLKVLLQSGLSLSQFAKYGGVSLLRVGHGHLTCAGGLVKLSMAKAG